MPNTNFQTIFQMPGIVNNIVKQATGRDSVSQIDMDFVTVGQDKQTVIHVIDYTAEASFVNNNQLPLTVLVKITAVQSGEGDPAPDNVRPITGWTGATITQTGGDTENEYTFTFPEEPGTVYGGVLNVTTGVLTVNMAFVDLGTLTPWKNNDSTSVYYRGLPLKPGSVNGMSNALVIADPAIPSGMMPFNACKFTNDGSIVVKMEGITINNASTMLDGVTLVYELNTPLTYQLTATEIDSLIGENNLSADTGDISVSYTSYIPVP